MWILVAVVIFSPGLVFAAPCTRGVNCYCDKVKPGGPLADPQLLLCEDFEAPTLHDDVGFGNGAPDFGPPYDDSGSPGWRGFNGYWFRTYGALSGTQWNNGQPPTPQRGTPCNIAGTCATSAGWRLDDLWNANTGAEHSSGGTAMVFYRNGEFQDEVNVATPTFPGGSGVFDGRQSFAHRVCAGDPVIVRCTSGIKGEKAWPGGARTTFGATMAVAYASNSNASGIFGAPWKHNEWASVVDPNGGFEGLLLFHVGGSLTSDDPFKQFILFKTPPDGTSQTRAGCQAKVAATTIRKGNIFCDSGSFRFHADPSYVQSTHWPLGTWGCVRGHYRNFGSSNVGITITLTTAVVTDMVIVDFDGFDDVGLNSRLGFTAMKWNAYSNAQQHTGETPTTQTTFRYEDNVHIRAGQPVSCAQIGFPAGSLPVGPTGLLVSP